MLDRFKQTIKQLFVRDDEKRETKPTMRESSGTVDAKVVYQYPKKQSFRFPMSVDQPAVHTRERTRASTQDRRNRVEEQVEVKTRPPFKASDVASPVHGYQSINRKESTSLEKPAFLRKDREERLQARDVGQTLNKDLAEDKTDDNQTTTITELRRSRRAESEKPEVDQQTPVEAQVDNEPVKLVEKKAINDQPRMNQKTARNRARRSKHKHRRKQEQPTDNLRAKEQDQQQALENKQALPSLNLLNDQTDQTYYDQEWIDEQSKKLTATLAEFNVKARVVNARQGPTVTQFEVQPEAGVKVSKIRNLSDDIKLNMAAKDIRIEAPIPGKNAIGIEIPNKVASPVGLAEIFKSKDFSQAKSPLTIGLGLDISGRPIVTNIKKMPHGLIAGATGSGKSVCINTILTSLIYQATPRDVRFLLIDPKMVELASYNDIPHLVSPVITDVKAATQALKWAVEEMEERYQKFVSIGARDIESYNQKIKNDEESTEKMPYLVIVIDELADLMMMAPQDVEDSISRIAQKARACGIHLLLATQRPSVDVITGLIKANIPTRIAFSVASQVDSRTIIDQVGADRLLGKGDMLFVENGARHPLRIQGAFVSDEEIDRITADARKREAVNYLFKQDDLLEKIEQEDNEDELYDEVVSFVIEHNSASTSLLQRRFKIGYNRAARLIDSLEQSQIISGQNGSKPRTILVSKEE